MSELLSLSAWEIARAVGRGELGVREVVEFSLDRIERLDPGIGAFIQVDRDRARSRAREVEQRLSETRGVARASGPPPELPLAGVPVAIKDNLCTSWGATTCSSNMLRSYHSPYTATAVRLLEKAGAVVVGKTNLDEFAMGSSTETSAFGVTRNPWDRDRVAGGSSGGSAAAVAAGLCAGALGSDTGGSIRQPAAFCGVVGLKPSYGRVSRYGLVAYGSSLDQIGPLAGDVRDAALLLGAIAAHDPRDSTSVARPGEDYVGAVEAVDRGDWNEEPLRVGLPREFFGEALSAETAGLLEAAVEVFRRAGARVVEVELPHSSIEVDEQGRTHCAAVACYYVVAMAEASSNLARYDGVHYGHRTADAVADIVELYARSRAEGFGEEVKRRVMLGAYALSAGYYDAYYNKALKVRRLIKQDFDRAFADCDVLLAPTSPGPAFRIGEKSGNPLAMYREDIFTIGANLAGLPALSMPCGLTDAGLPVGMQLIGGLFGERVLLQAARLYEREAGLSRLVPEMAS